MQSEELTYDDRDGDFMDDDQVNFEERDQNINETQQSYREQTEDDGCINTGSNLADEMANFRKLKQYGAGNLGDPLRRSAALPKAGESGGILNLGQIKLDIRKSRDAGFSQLSDHAKTYGTTNNNRIEQEN